MDRRKPRVLVAGMSRPAARAAGLSPFPGQTEPRLGSPGGRNSSRPPAASARRDYVPRPRGSWITGSACWRQDIPRSPARRGNPRL